MTDLSFALLGPVTARARGHIVTIGPPQRRCLLAVLLLAQRQAVPVAVLRERLWAGAAPASAVTAIQVHVHHLRRFLAAHAGTGADAPQVLAFPGHSRDQASYALHTHPGAVDVHEVRRLTDLGRDLRRTGDSEGARRALRTAVELWHGEPLVDLATTPYLAAVRQGFADLHRDAREQLATTELSLGAVGTALPLVRQLLLDHPRDEGLVLRLCTALGRAGAADQALPLLDGALHRSRQQAPEHTAPPERLLHLRERLRSDGREAHR
ncbi:BTAD domain-containing putative transcriptional regulator [Kitasatospora sp. NPDC058048]|uniref:AfsR/SARP family transcriptional regulator n=1 Tax=Kitasatospora sp. NPDC058048 TaxID=3346313 RepID=UPI0036DF8FE3